MTDQNGASAVIACWRYMKARQTPGSWALFAAVNDMWAWRAYQIVSAS